MDERLRNTIEDAVVRALEAGIDPEEIRDEVNYNISVFQEDNQDEPR
jgi:hypothetical protein